MYSGSQAPLSTLWLWFTALVAPFFLNDFANIFVHDFKTWIIIDYISVKALPLGIIFFLVRSGRISFDDLGLKKLRAVEFLPWTVSMTLVAVLVVFFVTHFLSLILPHVRFGRIPWDPNSPLATFDLYFGLFLVGAFEEIIFRGLIYSLLRRQGLSVTMIFLLSSTLFGLIHWSFGPIAIVDTGIVGAVFMISVWKTGSVIPTIVAHFLSDFVVLSRL